jgi:nucleotide-binding universal stress UspA family protein
MTDFVAQTFSSLLVPLDGSRLAEAVLPTVEALAQRFDARVILMHILEQRPPATVHGEPHLLDAGAAAAYLERIAERLRGGGASVDTHVHDAPEGDVARSIAEHTDEYSPDLVVLCAHGRGGLRDLLFGGIAQQVLQHEARPVLLIPSVEDNHAPPFAPRRVLVPLERQHAYQDALAAAAAMARAFDAELNLVVVAATMKTLRGERAATGVLLPSTMRAILEMDTREAQDFLTRIAAECQDRGLKVTTGVPRGQVVPAVLDHAEKIGADLIVMASHGRAGLNALLSGSAASRITARVRCPLLLVRVRE